MTTYEDRHRIFHILFICQPVERVENLEDLRGHSLQEWVSQIAPRTEIFNRFRHFLMSYRDRENQDAYIYREKIAKMCHMNLNSFAVSYEHLARDQSVLAFFLPECPNEILELFNAVLCLLDFALGDF